MGSGMAVPSGWAPVRSSRPGLVPAYPPPWPGSADRLSQGPPPPQPEARGPQHQPGQQHDFEQRRHEDPSRGEGPGTGSHGPGVCWGDDHAGRFRRLHPPCRLRLRGLAARPAAGWAPSARPGALPGVGGGTGSRGRGCGGGGLRPGGCPLGPAPVAGGGGLPRTAPRARHRGPPPGRGSSPPWAKPGPGCWVP